MIDNGNIFGMLRDLVNNGVYITCGSGAPTNGTTGAGLAGPGSIYIDFANALLYQNTGTLASPTWTAVYSGALSQNVAYAKYDFSVDGGAIGAITPATTESIPKDALVVGGVINSTTAVTSAGSATVSVGTSAGSNAASILGATAKASLSLDAVIESAAVAAPFKMSAAGNINVTVATAALTAGVIEVFVFYVMAKAD